MKFIFWIYISLVILIHISCGSKKERQHPESPNIVLIISDDQSWTDYSLTGHPYIKTPNIDRLAQSGLTFSHGYTTAPLCRPALASMATGLYPFQHQVFGNDPVFKTIAKPYTTAWLQDRKVVNDSIIAQFQERPSLATWLNKAGYISFQSGKWWEGSYEKGGFTEGMTHGNPARKGRHGDEGLTIGRDGLDPIFEFMEKAEKQEKPFFIWYAPFLPHAPHTPPDSLKEKYIHLAPSEAVANYWAMCEWFDITCGQLEEHLIRQELRENTIIVYVTDNGWIQDPDRPNRYAPRSKRAPYEMGIRTPIIFNWPGKIRSGIDSTNMVSSIDIMPTLLALCGIPLSAALPGINVLDKPTLASRKMIFAETYAHDFSSKDSSIFFRIGIQWPWKLILPDPNNKPDDSVELFNLEDDPHELTNQASKQPKIVADLTKEIIAWQSEN